VGDLTDRSIGRGGRLSAPSPIGPDHDLGQFHCGTESLDDWLRLRALKSEGRSSRTYVVSDGPIVVGYYCLSTGAEKRASVPSKIARNTSDPVPLILLGRLAVDLNYQGRRIGAGLLKDALQRVAQVSKAVGSRALIVHAIDRNATAFYVKYGFIEFPQASQTLFLPIDTIAGALSSPPE
jgi:GNAT superfamily N-acetyltransferase